MILKCNTEYIRVFSSLQLVAGLESNSDVITLHLSGLLLLRVSVCVTSSRAVSVTVCGVCRQ